MNENFKFKKGHPKILKVVSDSQVVISAGSRDGVEHGEQFYIFEVGEDLFDPDTNESLGKYEVKKGLGKASHVMEKLTVIDAAPSQDIFNMLASNNRIGAFKNPKVGDEARPLTWE